jgi:hypothetical protein
LTAFTAWVPQEGRKLLLFSMAFALCVGGIVVWVAREYRLSKRWAVIQSVSLTIAGLVLIAVQGHRELRAERKKAEMEESLLVTILEAIDDPNSALAEMVQRHRLPSFADYLALRVLPLGEWPQPWPWVFWIAEILLAAAAGMLLVIRLLRTPSESAIDNS